ncbi:MAG TPA: hypothetical protein VF655_04715 [Allosphingosinicella sp.]
MDDDFQACSQSGKTVRFGGSHVEAFTSTVIDIHLRIEPDCAEIWVGEDASPDDSSEPLVRRIDQYRETRSFEGLRIAISRKEGKPRVDIARTRAGGCPIYVSTSGTSLTVSWRFEEAALAIPQRKPSHEACTRYLKLGPRPVREQVIEGLFMLWPGEALTFDHDGLRFSHAKTLEVVVPGSLTDHARVSDAFVELLAEALQPALAKARNPLVEVSGGYDSSCVAIAASSVRSGLNSYAVIHEGAIGAQQQRRRREIVQLLGLSDFVRPSNKPPPFESLQVPECSFTPLDDVYRLACIHAVEEHPAGPFDLAVTGIGGDEITKENTFHREDWEVPGSICSSAADAAAGRSDMFMRRGIWLVQPFVNQNVVDFCRALPRKLRAERMLNILTLARAGLSDGYIFPRYYEHYANVIGREASLIDFDDMFQESLLGDLGIMDVSAILWRAREGTRDGLELALVVELWLALKLDGVLRRYLN